MELVPELCAHELLFNSVGGHDQQLVVYKKEKKKDFKVSDLLMNIILFEFYAKKCFFFFF